MGNPGIVSRTVKRILMKEQARHKQSRQEADGAKREWSAKWPKGFKFYIDEKGLGARHNQAEPRQNQGTSKAQARQTGGRRR